MGDMIDLYGDLRKHKQEERAKRRAADLLLLAEEGINLASINNDGAHIIVNHGGRVIDYWPGTSLWIDRKTQKRRRGVRQLINYCKGGTS